MKPYRHILIILCFGMINISIWTSLGYGSGDDKARSTLSGIGSIDIIFDWDGKGMNVGEYGYEKDTIQTFIKKKLEDEGIKVNNVHSCDTIDTIKGAPFLYIEMHTYRCSYEEHTVYFDVKFFQEVVLEKDSSKSFIAPTWSSGGTITIARVAAFTDIISELLGKFASAYLSVNPKRVAESGQLAQKYD